MKLSDHPLPVKKISSENVFYWWSHQVFRNQWNQKSDDRSKFSTPIQLRLYRGSNSPRKCSPDVVAYSEKTHSSKKFFTPLATGSSALALPFPVPYYPMSRNDLRSWRRHLRHFSKKRLNVTNTKSRNTYSITLQQSFVLRSNASQHSLSFRIVIFLGNC